MTALRREPGWMVLTVDMATKSESNQRGHWGRKADRVTAQHETVGWAMVLVCRPEALPEWLDLARPLRLVRVSPRGLDGDNLAGALKAVRDEVAKYLWGGRYGQRDNKCRWEYDQRRGATGEQAVEIWLPDSRKEQET